ncbi:MAG: hypothetical protein EAX95_01330 [Candidatus Thorarchaeota archaeon]|nr:hypothetical protein [Candidatus Thorarchaeota archaeon]
MVRYDVAICTRNPKVIYLIVELVKELGLSFAICRPDDYRTHSSRVIVTTTDEGVHLDDRAIILETDFEPQSTTIAIMLKLLGIMPPFEFVVGVDPGMQYGLALLANGNPIHTRTMQSPRDTARNTLLWSEYILNHYNSELTIRVGTGSRLYSVLYLRAIIDEGNSLPVELVDEHHTTLAGESDKSSAVLIALRSGRPLLAADLHLDLKAGYVKSLKHFAKRLTNGRRTLSTSEAYEILSGELSIDRLLFDSN